MVKLLAQVPDVGIVLGNGTVAAEHARLGDVDQALAAPAQRVVGVVGQGLALAHHVGVEVRQGLEPILVDQLVVQALQVLGIAGSQHFGAGQEVDGAADVGVALVPLGGAVIGGLVTVDDLVGGLAEDVDIVVAHLLADLDVGAVHGAQGQGAVQHELHVAGAGSLLGGQGDLLGQVAGGDELLGGGDVVVLHKHHLQPGADLGVSGDDLGQGQQGVDDVLGDDVRRGGLGAEDADQRGSRGVAGLDLVILVDEVEQVELLALVLMQALGLDVEHGVGVDGHALGALQPVGQRLLVVSLHLGEALQHVHVVFVGQQLFQLSGILAEAGADELLDQAGQGGVALQQPAAEGDAVCLIVEFLGVQLVETVQLGVLQDLGVQVGHAVGGVGEVDVHVGHVDAVVLVDDGQALVLGAGAGQLVQLLDDGHQLRDHGIQVGAGPLLQGFGQDGVVGVGAGLGDNFHSFVKFNALLAQQAD